MRQKKKVSTVKEIMIRSTDYLRCIIAPAERQGDVTMSYLCPRCNSFPLKDYVWWVSVAEISVIGGARFAEKSTTGSNQTGSRWCKQAKV